jgi:hypothetical protein
MKRHTITFAVLAAAVLCYVAGWNDGGAALLAAGGVFELIFWSRILRGSKSSSGSKPAA